MNEIIKNNQNKCCVFFILLLLIISASFSIGNDQSITTYVTSNGSMYLLQGMKIYNGDAISVFYRGPMYPILLSISFMFGDKGLISAHWMNETIFFFCILLLFWLSYELYGSSVALLSAFIPITAIWMLSIRRDFDPAFLLSAFIILTVIFIIKGEKSRSNKYFYAAGVCLGLTFLTKEIGLLYLILPLFLTPLRFEKNSFFILLRIYISALFVITPWIVFLILNDQSLSMLLGEMRPGANRMGSFFGEKTIIEYAIEAFAKGSLESYNSISEKFTFFPLALIGFFVIVLNGLFKRDKNDLCLFLSLAPILPIVLLYGLYQDGLRHIVVFLLFSCTALARLFQISKRILFKNKHILNFSNVIAANSHIRDKEKPTFFSPLFIFFLLTVFCFNTVVAINSKGIGSIYFGYKVTPKGRYGQKVKIASDWLNENLTPGSIIHAGGMYGGAVKFFTKEKYEYNYIRENGNMPMYYWIDEIVEGINFRKVSDKVKKGKIVAITTSRKFRSSHLRYRRQIIVMFENDYLNFIDKVLKKKKWIMTHDDEKVRFPFIEKIISRTTNKRYENMGIGIFETNPSLTTNNTCFGGIKISSWTIEDLKWLKENYNSEFKKYLNFFNTKGINLPMQ